MTEAEIAERNLKYVNYEGLAHFYEKLQGVYPVAVPAITQASDPAGTSPDSGKVLGVNDEGEPVWIIVEGGSSSGDAVVGLPDTNGKGGYALFAKETENGAVWRPLPLVSQSQNGLMTIADKNNLDAAIEFINNLQNGDIIYY